MNAFDLKAAQRALYLLQLAHDRWLQQATVFDGTRFDDLEHQENIGVQLQGTAIEALIWARGLDDWCRELPDYATARVSFQAQLDGARYAVNRSVHQLTVVTQAFGVMNFPLTFGSGTGIFNTFGGIRWANEGYLPPRADERDDTQRRLRDAYVKHLAGQEIGRTLASIRQWFERQLPEEPNESRSQPN